MDIIDYKTYGLGCLKDKYDPRDYVFFPTCATAYPTAYMLEKMPIKNQQTVNSCVAHACATIKEIQEYIELFNKLVDAFYIVYELNKEWGDLL